MVHKLKSQRGETLVEALAAILIASLSVALLFSCVMASTQMDETARAADERYYKALTAAETQTYDADYPAKAGEVTIKGSDAAGSSSEKKFEISLYGGEGMYAYAEKEADP